jgi:ATP-dependent DNA helicase PIF1
MWVCKSADEVVDDINECAVGVEYLNTLDPGGMPPHDLRLRKGVPVILLRNLDRSRGLCNGTRLIVEDVVQGRLLTCRIASTNELVFLPRIAVRPSDGEYAFTWTRRQFPVRLAFAMSINKAQGQSLGCVGVYLGSGCFTHGQLYVAASRVGAPDHIRFAVADPSVCETRNPVYRSALLDAGGRA